MCCGPIAAGPWVRLPPWQGGDHSMSHRTQRSHVKNHPNADRSAPNGMRTRHRYLPDLQECGRVGHWGCLPSSWPRLGPPRSGSHADMSARLPTSLRKQCRPGLPPPRGALYARQGFPGSGCGLSPSVPRSRDGFGDAGHRLTVRGEPSCAVPGPGCPDARRSARIRVQGAEVRSDP